MTTTQNTSNIVQFSKAIYAEMKSNPVAMKFVVNYYEFKFSMSEIIEEERKYTKKPDWLRLIPFTRCRIY